MVRKVLIFFVGLALITILGLMAYITVGLNWPTTSTPSPASVSHHTSEENYSLASSRQIVIVNPLGNVKVIGDSVEEIELSMVLSTQGLAQADFDKLAANLNPKITVTEDRLEISTLVPDLAKGLPISLDYSLRVPQQLDVAITNSLGTLALENITGEFELHNLSGNVLLDNVSGRGSIRADSGNITATNLRTESNLAVHAQQGDVMLAGLLGEQTSITMREGELKLELPADVSYTFTASYPEGSLSTTGYGFVGNEDGISAKGIIGAGSLMGEITVSIDHGEIKLYER